jgi:hypothetical protein
MKNKVIFMKFIPQGILVLSLTLVYLNTMAPGLTWANDGADGGDLITAAATGGVPHPTGYPVYLLLARLFQLLPIGPLAFRTNLMSAVAAVLAALLVYALVTNFLPHSNGNKNWLAGLAAALAFGLSPLIWSQAVITEVYTLHALFVALILNLSCNDSILHFGPKRVDIFTGLTFGLALGNHITAILLFPLILFSPFSDKATMAGESPSAANRQSDKSSFLRRLIWLGIGLSVYLILPMRALSQPYVNWGNPVTLTNFGWLISGRLYQDQLFILTFSSVWSRIRSVAGLLIGQFGIPGLVIGLMGLIVFYKPSHLYRNSIWTFFAFIIFAIVYATHDSFMYLIPAFMCFAIWIGLGLGGLMEPFVQRHRQIGLLIGPIMLLYLFILAGYHWSQVDASQDLRAERFGMQVLAQAPKDAIVFTKGDRAIFSMWYFNYALKKRPDLVVVVTDLLHFEWYQKTLHTNYPHLELSDSFRFAENVAAANPDRPVCYVEYTESSKILCLPEKSP